MAAWDRGRDSSVPSRRRLSIGGVGALVTCGQAELVPPPSEAYEHFLDEGPLSGLARAGCIEVKVLVGAPTAPRGDLVFDTGTNWSAYSEPNGGYRLVFTARDGSEWMQVICDALTSNVAAHVARSLVSANGTLDDPFCYPLDQLLLMNHLASRQGFIVHAAGLRSANGVLAFCGVSGAGKTTISRLLGAAGKEPDVLSDDRLIIRAGEGGFDAWGTPWPGEARIARNESAPLRALVFLAKAAENRVIPLEPGVAARRLAPMVSCPWYDRQRMPEVLDTCAHLVESVPGYELQFVPDASVVELLTQYFGGT